MSEEHVLSFGSYKDKTILETAKEFPSYILWIGGVTTKYSLTAKAKELYNNICQEHAADVQAVKDFLQDRCRNCWDKLLPDNKHVCKTKSARSEGFYHYHPYGKRT